MTDLREDNETLYVGNLDFKVTEELLYELFLQAGPIKSLTIPKDKSTKKPRSFGFVTFKDEVSMPYAYYLFRELPLFGKPLKVEPRNKRYNIPPANCVGVHSIEPKIGKNNESQEASVRDLTAQNQFSSCSPQQQLTDNVRQSPNSSSLMSLSQPYWMLNYNCNNNVDAPLAIDTNAMINFKNCFENSPLQHESNSYNHRSNQCANFSPTFNDLRDRDRSHNSSRFSDDIHFSPRLSGRLEFHNNGRNNHSPYNDRNSTPKSNSRGYHQGHGNSSHSDSYSRRNDSPRSNFNHYNDRDCNSPNSPYYNRSFNNNSRNNSPYNDRGRAHFPGKRDSHGNDDRRDYRRSRDGGGGSHHNRSYHNDRNQRY
ncbi:UNVERIFIED_CONTAM: hypothetical protein RMT77_017284 [Armadillidium vulgare]